MHAGPFAVLGPFADWYPAERDGFHLGGVIGAAAVPLVRGIGMGASLWGGYDLWISPQWSIGIAAHVIGTTDFADSGLGGGAVLSALYH